MNHQKCDSRFPYHTSYRHQRILFYQADQIMEVKKINTDALINIHAHHRPDSFDEFIGQEHIKGVLKTAIESGKKRKSHVGHILFSGPSGFGKTTIAHIISKQSGVNIKAVTGYAITKPSEIISILNTLET
jgi:holliday junction DNA helicase RuvB